MRKRDVWVGRIAAVAGLLYLAVCSLQPLRLPLLGRRDGVARREYRAAARSA